MNDITKITIDVSKVSEADVRLSYNLITKTLIKEKLYITTMESCTSGQIASLITDTEGASAIIKGAAITYSNEAKIKEGVSSDIIEKYGVYSIETAGAMAETILQKYGADIGIGVTGTFGNTDPANSDSIPGKVYCAVSSNTGKNSIKLLDITLKGGGSRYQYKLAVADAISKYIV
ncbi:MAG: CinA family protein [Butyrivibrio sp.]|nr:CinA family protein [Butyrivibrio sp.]